MGRNGRTGVAALALTVLVATGLIGGRAILQASDEVAVQISGDRSRLPAVVQWAAKVWEQPTQPDWKRALARQVVMKSLAGKGLTRHQFRATWYCHDNSLDKTGGGLTTASGRRVRFGLVATDNRYWPIGSVFYCPELQVSLIAADNGPGVRGRRRVDVYVPDAETRDKFLKAQRGGWLTLYPLGWIPLKTAVPE